MSLCLLRRHHDRLLLAHRPRVAPMRGVRILLFGWILTTRQPDLSCEKGGAKVGGVMFGRAGSIAVRVRPKGAGKAVKAV